jgi:hypothetical protein
MGQTCSLMRKEDKIQNIGGKSWKVATWKIWGLSWN